MFNLVKQSVRNYTLNWADANGVEIAIYAVTIMDENGLSVAVVSATHDGHEVTWDVWIDANGNLYGEF